MSSLERYPPAKSGEEIACDLDRDMYVRQLDDVAPYLSVGVESIRPSHCEPPDVWGNQLSRHRVQMTDGTILGLNYCEPKDRATDIPVLETPAWYSGLHGFNEDGQRALGALGFPSLLIGPVGGERDSAIREVSRALLQPWRLVRELRAISLARQAHNMLEILTYDKLGFGLDNTNVFLYGKSRGAMTQFPFVVFANQRSVNVAFAMPVAPCFAKGFGRATIGELKTAGLKEVTNVARLGLRNMFDMTGSNVNTLNPSPKSLLYELANTKALLSGDAGRFARRVGPDQNMLILAYEDDLAGQKNHWEAIFANNPNIYVRAVPGAHLSIADKRTKAYVMQTFGRYAAQLRDKQPADQLDHSHIRRPLTLVKQ